MTRSHPTRNYSENRFCCSNYPIEVNKGALHKAGVNFKAAVYSLLLLIVSNV